MGSSDFRATEHDLREMFPDTPDTPTTPQQPQLPQSPFSSARPSPKVGGGGG